MRLACIGIGSNAIRLLIAQWSQEGLCVIRRERRGTRLFAGLVDGALTQQSIRSSVEAVAELDRQFVEDNLSPGGCADLLAIAFFLYYLNEEKTKWQT